MTNTQHLRIEKDPQNRNIRVSRYFDASPALVWRAWTEAELLDRWWAPKPYRAETKHMDFRPGGQWFYAMVSPEGNRDWVRVDFKEVNPIRSFSCRDNFADEHGNALSNPPGMDWHTAIEPEGTGTRVNVRLDFDSEDDLKKIVEMGFEEGFTAALGNLDEYFSR